MPIANFILTQAFTAIFAVKTDIIGDRERFLYGSGTAVSSINENVGLIYKQRLSKIEPDLIVWARGEPHCPYRATL